MTLTPDVLALLFRARDARVDDPEEIVYDGRVIKALDLLLEVCNKLY